MGETVVELSIHAVIPQACHGSARCFLNRLLMTWSYASVQTKINIKINLMKILPLSLLNSTYSKTCMVILCEIVDLVFSKPLFVAFVHSLVFV